MRKRTLAELSYGQARRVLFARAWAREPRLALLDEPFAGLDRATRADLTRRLNDWIAEGGSCVIATHHRDEWPAHTTHVLELAAGARCRVIAWGKHEEAALAWLAVGACRVAGFWLARLLVSRIGPEPVRRAI